MPSRTAMVLAQNGVSSAGDPFLGALVRGAFAIGKGVVKLFKKKVTSIATRGPAAIATRAPVLTGRLGALRPLAVGAAKAAGLGAAFEVGSRIIGFNQDGTPIFGRKRRRRGITATELRGFRKVTSLLHRVGMTPRGLGRVRHHHHR